MLRKVIRASCPTMLAVLFSSLYGVIDGLFVGNATGDVGLAAVNIGWPIVALIMALGVGIGTGGSVLISYFRGKGELEQAKNVYGTVVTFLLIVGITLLLLLFVHENMLYLLGARAEVYVEAEKYIRIWIYGSVSIVLGSGMLPILRNIDMAVEALVCMIVGVVLNIVANYYLMIVLDMGVRGAALGTVIAQSTVVVIAFISLARNKEYGICLAWHREFLLKIIKSGITPFGIYLAPSITLIFTNLQCLKYGGDAVVASYAVISYITFPVLSMLGSVGDGTQPLISFYFGANKENELKSIRRIAYVLLVALSGCAVLITIVFAEAIAKGFGLSEMATPYFLVGMRISAIAFLGQAFTKFNGVYLNATMRSGFAVLLTYVESLVISPIMLLLLPMTFQLTGIWLAPTATALIVLGIYYRNEYRSKDEFIKY